MSAHRYNPDIIAHAERLVSQLQGISSCRISIDESGEISAVHVVSRSDKPAKLVARDVESALQAEMGITVDHRKIGVAVYESEEQQPTQTDEGLVEFPVEEYASRFAFNSVNLFISPDSVQAEVELVRDGVETFGSARAENLGEARLRVTAEATLRAVSELLDEGTRLCLADVSEILIGDDTVVVVKVDIVHNRQTKRLVGCALYSGDTNQTVVFATLDSINRVMGVLKRTAAIEYNIE